MLTDEVSENMDVYILAGNIALIKPAGVKKYLAAEEIDGTGKYMMPGLYDMHVHFPTKDAERFFQLQTAAGIVAARIMKSNEVTLPFKKNNTNLYNPELYISYNFFGNEDISEEKLSVLIDSVKLAGYNFIKCFGIKSPAFFDTLMATAKRNNLYVCGHALQNIPPLKLIASGYRSIEHVGYFDKAKPATLDSLIDIAVKNNLFNCPTVDWAMMVYHTVPEDSLKYRAGFNIGYKLYKTAWDSTYAATATELGTKAKQYGDYMRNDVTHKLEVLSKMRGKGLKIIAGSDAEEPFQTPGYSLVDELKLIKKAGYSNYELLQMVTTNAAAFFNKQNIIEKGKTTTFILLAKNPFDNIDNLSSVEFVFKNNSIINTKLLLTKIK